jgi:hypothetical protein
LLVTTFSTSPRQHISPQLLNKTSSSMIPFILLTQMGPCYLLYMIPPLGSKYSYWLSQQLFLLSNLKSSHQLHLVYISKSKVNNDMKWQNHTCSKKR